MTAVAVVVTAGLAGWASVRLLVRPVAELLDRPPHLRTNYRDRTVVGTLGALLVVPVCVGTAGAWVMTIAQWGFGRPGLAAGGAGIAMGALGLWDDLYATSRAGGFLGHLRSLRRGEYTTGLGKAVGGGIVGLGAAYIVGWRGAWILAAGAVVALTANLVNLLDLRPGRALKVWLAAWGLTWIALPPTGASAVGTALAGGAIAFLPADLSERGMLGDAGANLLGATLGVILVSSLGTTSLLVVLGVLVVLTGASEVVSFSRVIDDVGILRRLDGLGRTGA